jgi:hypothetical protein
VEKFLHVHPPFAFVVDARADRVVGGGVAFALLRGKTVYREIPA